MLKLRKIHILGFKSFCDRTELALSGTGIACVVGPNGCGKSNILDGVSWVLGEQSAKTLRGAHMQDVIFAGTRDRKPLGMAEVTVTMVDPATFEGPIPVEPELHIDNESPADWDEQELRRQHAQEAEEIISEQQPGLATDEDSDNAEPAAQATQQGGPQPVMVKIRRRKFHSTPQKGEIVITRRLFRTGDSEYLLNGKLCRLRDIQDIFMGTGLGPESYAIIGQERIGQLLSSKPHDRRSIIEEAAGITRFKNKKRLAELRLESSRQNMARVDDIFEEVTRQMNSLKRQASKAERFAAVRDELRGRLRVVVASRMAQMDSEQVRLEQQIALLTAEITTAAAAIEEQEASQHSMTERGYQLDSEGQEAQSRASNAAVELERAKARERSNVERIRDLEARVTAATAELEQTRVQLAGIAEERTQHRSFLDTAASESQAFRQQVEARQQEARAASEEVFKAERDLETGRRQVMVLLTQAGNARNQTAQAEESLAALEREAERLTGELDRVNQEQEHLGALGAEARLRYESAAETLKRLETEIAQLRESLQARRAEETALRTRSNQLREEQATVAGRRNSLEATIRNHSYSTETVRRLLKPGSLGANSTPVGTLADFLEVSGEHEGVVDEFLRDELNYVVVESWVAAEQGVRLLKSSVDGRATFLIHPPADEAVATAENPALDNLPGLAPLRKSIRVLNGFGHSLEAILPKLANGYVVEDPAEAQRLADRHPLAYFLTPEGECFHNATVTGGKPAAEGPLALKRDLREAERKLAGIESALAESETQAADLAQAIEQLTADIETRSDQRRQAEREAADQGATLKQMETETQRVERRVAEFTAQAARNREATEAKQQSIEARRTEAARLEAEHKAAEAALEEHQAQLAQIRQKREDVQQEAARVTAELAGLEERRRGAESAFQRIDRLHTDLSRRVATIEQQRTAAEQEREQRTQENAALAVKSAELAEIRAAALTQTQTVTAQAHELRTQLATLEATLKTGRSALDQIRDQRSEASNLAAKLKADLEHLEASCLAEVNVEAAAIRVDETIERIEGEALAAEEETCHGLKQRIEQMGPVNMMALDEYKESAERHSFLDVQRKDLQESIENTVDTIKEIDRISRTKFDEAFARINENFAQVFTRLFRGGQAFLRLTDAEDQAESGLDIVASPPGKKLQNVLLLSGGEKALTALALLVGIFQFQPSPFCILDEVDAPLDDVNVGRLADLLVSLARETQFLIVTHSKRMMQAADQIYGVTMQEPGCSKVLSVHLGREQHRATA
jgi:chromosome segregation protein